ncbi:AraC family transcriptional regulator [Bacillota bacterium Meth-B3]
MQILLDDDKVWTEGYKRLPSGLLRIPSLYMIGHAKHTKAWDPLITHYHKTLEIVVLVNGHQQYFLNGSLYALQGGNMFVTFPREVHGNGDLPQNACEFIWFQLDMEPGANFLGLLGDMGADLYRRIANTKMRVHKVSTQSIRLLQRAWECLSAQDEGKRLLGYTSLISFLVESFSMQPEGTDNRAITPDIKHALGFIQRNLSVHISVVDIADACQLSESRFKAKFKEQMGITPLHYVNSLKIDLAKKMLKESDICITELAFMLDFGSSNYFTSVFKQYTGYAPQDFRRAEFHMVEE